MKVRNLLFLIGGILLGAAVGYAILINNGYLFGNRGQRDFPTIGKIAPNFLLYDVNGAEVRLDDWQGKAVIVNFWATWCKPCTVEMPLFEQYYRKYADRLVILAVNYDEELPEVARFIDKMEISFPILMDPGARITDQYLVNAFPTSYFIDANGILQAQYVGSISEAILQNYLTKIGLSE